jgi:hypothetical protein
LAVVVVVLEIAASYEMDIIPEKKRNVSSLYSKWIHTISLTLAFPVENWNYFFVLRGTWGHCNPYLNSLFRFKQPHLAALRYFPWSQLLEKP